MNGGWRTVINGGNVSSPAGSSGSAPTVGAGALKFAVTGYGVANPPASQTCPAVPTNPQNADVNKNITQAQIVSTVSLLGGPLAQAGISLGWFAGKELPNKAWDYKTQGQQYDAFGNFNYGAVGGALWHSRLCAAGGWRSTVDCRGDKQPKIRQLVSAAPVWSSAGQVGGYLSGRYVLPERVFLLVMARARKFRLLCWVVAVAIFCGIVGCAAYLRSATSMVQDHVSPDGKREAIVVVVNGGGMTGFVTAVSIVDAHYRLGREFAIMRGRRDFLIDDNDGAVRWGAKGEIDLRVRWLSSKALLISYPKKARVIQQRGKDGEVAISYGTT